MSIGGGFGDWTVASLSALDSELCDLSHLDSYVEVIRETAARRRFAALAAKWLRECSAGRHAEDILADARTAILAEADGSARGRWQEVGAVLAETDRLLRTDGFKGTPFGFRDLDGLTNGGMAGQLILVAGRPGAGKSSFALSAMQHQARAGYKPAIFSLEMTAWWDMGTRLLSSWSRVPYTFLLAGLDQLHELDRESLARAQGELAALNIGIDDRAGLSLEQIAAGARQRKATVGLDVLYIDHGGLIRLSRRYGDSTQAQTAYVSRSLKELAKELGIPIVCLLQLNRELERRMFFKSEEKDILDAARPRLSDLRDSGGWEQDADMVVFLFRPVLYISSQPVDATELIVAKHRNGPTGTIHNVRFLPAYIALQDRERGTV